MVGCLLCNRAISPFPIVFPSARGFERALLCRWHPRDSLDPEWFGLGPPAYWKRLDLVQRELRGCSLLRAWTTPGYFSLLFETSAEGLLLVYPQHESVLFSYVPKRLRFAERPSGLPPLTTESAAQKAGLSRLLAKLSGSTPLAAFDFGRDAEHFPDDKQISLRWADESSLTITACGWESLGAGSAPDVNDLSLSWESSPSAP